MTPAGGETNCKACGAENPAGSRFCGSCGASLALAEPCPSCGADNPAGQRFCNSCGANLEAEMDAARRPGFAPGYNPSPLDFDHPLDYHMIDGEHDVFGDGTVVLFPTFGHTPGHQSLRVRAGKGADLVCAADACYTQENMDRDVLPRVLWSAPIMRESLAALRRLRDQAGATMFYGHDPAQWEAMPHAPAPIA